MAKAHVEGVLIKYATFKGIFKSNPLIYFFSLRKANIFLTYFIIFLECSQNYWNALVKATGIKISKRDY